MISKVLMKNYEYLRDSIGLALTEEKKEDELGIDKVFSQLRSHSPYKLSKMIDPQFEPEKTESTRESMMIKGSYASTSFSIKNSADQIRNYHLYQSVNGKSSSFLKQRNHSTKSQFRDSYQTNTQSNFSSAKKCDTNFHRAFKNSNQIIKIKCMVNW